MPQLARNLIDAIQNTLLDSLVFRLFNMVFVTLSATILYEIGPMQVYAVLILIPTWIGLIFFAWLLGYTANRLPRPATTAFERLHRPNRNGFDAWHNPPAGGLNPSPFLRRLVTVLSRANRWLSAPVSLGWLAGLLALYALSFSSPEWLAMDGAWLDQHAALILGFALAFGLLLSLLAWGRDSQQRVDTALKIGLPA